jgi:hypothetical protein
MELSALSFVRHIPAGEFPGKISNSAASTSELKADS